MRALVILAHPDSDSFNHAIADATVQALCDNHHKVVFHDLYAEGFDPILPTDEITKDAALNPIIKKYCDELASTDAIVIIHPNWWGQPPAILKGWVDRVVRPGVAYEFLEGDGGEGVPVGLLKAKCVIVFNTSNTPEERERQAFGDPLELLWKNCIFDLCGAETFYRKMYRVIVTSSHAQRQQWLQEVRETIDRLLPGDF